LNYSKIENKLLLDFENNTGETLLIDAIIESNNFDLILLFQTMKNIPKNPKKN
jgi:hypothetical protein